jgi:hypothetical protein
MKRDIKLNILYSLAATSQPLSCAPIGGSSDITLNVRIGDGIIDSIDVFGASIPFIKGVPLDIFRWS